MLEKLKSENKVVGVKQLRKALEEDRVAYAFLAEDADPGITEPLMRLCRQAGTECRWVSTMVELGSACSIDVGAAAAGILKMPQED